MTIQKICPHCKEEKTAAEFHKSKSRTSGLVSWCKTCDRERAAEYRKNNKTALRAKSERERNDPAYKAWHRAWQLKTKYNLTPEQFNQILVAQNNLCALCKTGKPGGRYNAWQVDHDHRTGAVRGVLCYVCNKNLGIFEKFTQRLSVEDYLKNPPANKIMGVAA